MALPFPPEDLVRIQYDPADPAGLRSYDVPLLPTKQLVRVIDPQTDEYTPIGGVRLLGECDNAASCAFDPYTVASGTSRASFWLTSLSTDDNLPPDPIQFKIQGSLAGAPNDFFFGTFAGNSTSVQGMIAQIAGPLCDQWSIWMRVSSALAAPRPVRVTVRVILDRLPAGGIIQANGVYLIKGFFTV